MTYEEARQSIIEDGINLGGYGDFIDPEALPVAVDALEKQIPKKPIERFALMDMRKCCPVCGDVLCRPYPCTCGQKIDWSD